MSNNKICSKCKESKEFTCFYTDTSKIDQLSSYCKICRKVNTKENSLKNKDYIINWKKEYYIKNKVKLQEKNHIYYKDNKSSVDLINKIWLENNRESDRSRRNKRKKERKKIEPLYRISENLRSRLKSALKVKKWQKNNQFNKYIGCEKSYLITHLENKFQLNMSWENYGKWEIDHIIPLSSAKTEEDLHKLCHYTNLQPLWRIDNIKKGNKIICQSL